MMGTSTTTEYRYTKLAAFAASCVVGAAPVHAVATTSTSFDHFRHAFRSSSDWLDATADGHVFIYVEDSLNKKPVLHRETTEQEHLIALLRGYERLGQNWDGEGAQAPNVGSLRAASDFACLLSQKHEIPEPLLHATGRAGLAWSADGSYGEIEFLGDGTAAYFFTDALNRHKGVVTLDGRSIPPSLEVLLPVA